MHRIANALNCEFYFLNYGAVMYLTLSDSTA